MSRLIPLFQLTSLLILLLSAASGCEQSTPSEAAATNNAAVNAAGSLPAETDATLPTQPCCDSDKSAVVENTPVAVETLDGGVTLPDAVLLNQDGVELRLSDIGAGRIVVLNFIFTTCRGICPPMGANYAQLQRLLGDRYGDDVVLVSITVDPTVDVPVRLKAWREKFGVRNGWTLLTGAKPVVDGVLKEFQVFTADKNDHSPFILLGDASAGVWRRVHGLTPPEKLAELIEDLYRERQPDGSASGELPASSSIPGDADQPAAQKWFTDVELINHHGEPMRFYSDLLQGKTVVVNSFFSTCRGSCPALMGGMARIQERYADRLGKDLVMISITVDPQTDTPETLASYARQWNAQPGWFFLTGEPQNVDTALFKIGQYAPNKESHSNVFIIGNERTGLWKKARGLSDPGELYPLIDEVLNDGT